MSTNGAATRSAKDEGGEPSTWTLQDVIGPNLVLAVTKRPSAKAVIRQVVSGAASSPKVRRYMGLAAQELDEAVRRAGTEGAGVRTQYRMVKELAARQLPSPSPRAFRPGCDDAMLLRINNEAFSWHPEQGGWDAQRLEQILAESWFQPDGLLLTECDGEPTGFCWTRVTPSRGRSEGAIWVIAVASQERGHGIGQTLLAAGEQHLYQRGCRLSTLYVDAANKRALILFIRNGYIVDRVETLYGEAPLRPQ